MEKFYITFGQVHVHRTNGKTFDCDCVALIEAENFNIGRRIAFDLFGDKFHNQYTEGEWSKDKAAFFPRGVIKAN